MRTSSLPRLIGAALLVVVACVCIAATPSSARPLPPPPVASADPGAVAVDFFVMSRCPDAVFCESWFAPALAAVSSIVDLRLNYIANETAPGVFVCRHGPAECEGDMQQLCARQHAPPQKQQRRDDGSNPVWFDFALCQSNSSKLIPTNGASCAASVGLDFSTIDSCVQGGEGASLLSASAARRTNANESISCTINLNEQFYCQHNGDWVGCTEGTSPDEMVAAVCKRYTGTNPPQACVAALKQQQTNELDVKLAADEFEAEN